MSLASSSLGKAILVLIVIVVSILIFSSKVKDASLPFLNWGEEESSSGSSYVVSSIQLAVKNLNTFHNFVFSDSPDSLSFNLGEDNFYVYYGIYKGENYYLMFKDEDPGLKLGSSYELKLKGKDLNTEVEKCNWWTLCILKTNKDYDVAYFDKMDFLIYDAERYGTQKPELLSCPEGKFCVTARLVNKKKYYFSHYIYNAKSDCADYYPEVAFVASSKKNNLGDSSKLCIDETKYAYSLFDDLFKSISEKETFDLSAIKNLYEKFLVMIGIYKDDKGSFKSKIALCDFNDTRFNSAEEYLTMVSGNWQTYADYDKAVFDDEEGYLSFDEGTLKCEVLRSQEFTGFLNGPLPFNYKEEGYTEENWNDYVNKLKNYLNSVSLNTFIPVFYLSKNSFVLVQGPYTEPTFHLSSANYNNEIEISLKCNADENYCYFEPSLN